MDDFVFDNKDHPPEEEDCVLVFSEKKFAYSVGKILTEHHFDASYEVSYLMRYGEARGTKFVSPTVPNNLTQNIKMFVPKHSMSCKRRIKPFFSHVLD